MKSKQEIKNILNEIDRTGLLFVGIFIGSLCGMAGISILSFIISSMLISICLVLLKYYKNKLEIKK